MTLTLAEAKQIVGAALDHARERSARVSACVCDEKGRFVALNRMDGAAATTNRQAIGKALASVSTGRSSDYMPGPGEVSGGGLHRHRGGDALEPSPGRSADLP